MFSQMVPVSEIQQFSGAFPGKFPHHSLPFQKFQNFHLNGECPDVKMRVEMKHLANPLAPVAPRFLQAARTFLQAGRRSTIISHCILLLKKQVSDLKENYTQPKVNLKL